MTRQSGMTVGRRRHHSVPNYYLDNCPHQHGHNTYQCLHHNFVKPSSDKIFQINVSTSSLD